MPFSVVKSPHWRCAYQKYLLHYSLTLTESMKLWNLEHVTATLTKYAITPPHFTQLQLFLVWLKAGLRNWLLKLVSCKNGSEFFNEVFCYKTQNITKHFQIIAAIWGKWSPEKHSAELSANVWLIYIKLWRMSEFPYQKCCKKNRQREKKSYICSHWHNFYVFDAVARWYLCGMFFFSCSLTRALSVSCLIEKTTKVISQSMSSVYTPKHWHFNLSVLNSLTWFLLELYFLYMTVFTRAPHHGMPQSPLFPQL